MEKIFVTKSAVPEFEEYVAEIKDIWNSRWLTNMGPKHNSFQALLKKRMNSEYVDLYTNGHSALEIALQALDVKGEVITTPFTFASTTHAIVRNGLTPVFCDIKASDFTIDEGKIEPLINEKTSAIMPVHVYGNICNVEEIKKLADKYSLKVIYDAAHAFDESYKGESVSRFGDASCFSFHATKVFNSIEGGANSFADKNAFEKSVKLKNFGYDDSDIVEETGSNAKMNEFCAAMGICNLRHLDDNIAMRKAIVKRYTENLCNVKGIRLNNYSENTKYNYSYFPIVVDEELYGITRDKLKDELENNNIFARKYFYPLTSDFECYKGKYIHGDTPVADYISERVLTLPLYPDLTIETIDFICRIIRNAGN